ncbi:MAG: hypothetical protein MK212_02690 [Saprospiraceae bacterium]|nr:hypothetical protein [Saprospiraceae bacterium]
MKIISAILCILSLTIFLGACENYKEDYEKVLQEKAAMEQKITAYESEEQLIKGEYSDAIETLNAIEDTLRMIAGREKQIQDLTRSREITGNLTQKQAIVEKLKILSEANQQAKNEAKRMKERIKSYKIENEQLKKMIQQAETRILEKERELEEARTVIDDMQRALNKMESQLLEKTGELASTYEELKNERDELLRTEERLKKTIADLQQKNTFIDKQARGYIACGSKRDLRRNGILQKTTMKLTREYQNAVQGYSDIVNYFQSNEFSCGEEGTISRILPERDINSYKLEGNKLIVTDNAKFWKTDKIVVLIKE